MSYAPDVKIRFNQKIQKTSSCWLWTAATRSGYGCLKIDGQLESAHRISYHLFKGQIPEGMYVCHTCDNKICVNPEHLFLGTQSDNMVDCRDKGRLIVPKTGRPLNKPKNRTITEEKAIEIKKELKINPSPKYVANKFGVSINLVADIVRGKSFKNV